MNIFTSLFSTKPPLTREDCGNRFAGALLHLSIHFPLSREDVHDLPQDGICHLSIHFPLTWEDGAGAGWHIHHHPFNPLPSHEGRLRQWLNPSFIVNFQSTSLSRGKTENSHESPKRLNLSIHFPLTREDYITGSPSSSNVLSIHFPLTREDNCQSKYTINS